MLNLSDDWPKAFPQEETRKVVTFLQTTWYKVVSKSLEQFHPGKYEPHLTTYLCEILQIEKVAVGLTGNFGAEELRADPDLRTGALKNRRRSDIRYFSDRKKVDLTFEFKKLKDDSTSRMAYWGESGMLRFVDGKYSRDKHLAIMVGIIATDREKNIAGIKRSIRKTPHAAQLHVQRDQEGECIRQPSIRLPALAEFDTVHSRTHTGDWPDILLCHLFLDHPHEYP